MAESELPRKYVTAFVETELTWLSRAFKCDQAVMGFAALNRS